MNPNPAATYQYGNSGGVMYAANRVAPVQVIAPPQQTEPKMPKTATLILASFQIICASVAVISQIFLIVYDYNYGVGYIGTGIWSGIFFGITGILGVVSAQNSSRGVTISFLVFSIISIIVCLIMFIIAIAGVMLSEDPYGYYNGYQDLLFGLNILQIFTAAVMGFVSIATIVLASRAICCQSQFIHGGLIYSQAVPYMTAPGQTQYGQSAPLQPGVAFGFQGPAGNQFNYQPLNQPQQGSMQANTSFEK